MDGLHRTVGMRPSLGMKRDDVGARRREIGQKRVNRADHQMHIEDLFCVRAQRLDDGGADRDVRHEMAVHHIDMDPIRTGDVNRAHFFTKPGKIGGQYRGGNQRKRHLTNSMQSAVGISHKPRAATSDVLSIFNTVSRVFGHQAPAIPAVILLLQDVNAR